MEDDGINQWFVLEISILLAQYWRLTGGFQTNICRYLGRGGEHTWSRVSIVSNHLTRHGPRNYRGCYAWSVEPNHWDYRVLAILAAIPRTQIIRLATPQCVAHRRHWWKVNIVQIYFSINTLYSKSNIYDRLTSINYWVLAALLNISKEKFHQPSKFFKNNELFIHFWFILG